MQKLLNFVASRRFFILVMAALVFQALWIALSGRYPMAFDEDFHLGIIRLYAHHLSPFWSAQPAHSDMFGAVYRDPSYLYHYIMSFPYRLIAVFAHSQTVQVIVLRIINIVLFTASLPLFRRLLIRTGASPALSNAVLAFFVLLPIAPFLAAQINYDNLFIPLVTAVLLLVTSINNELIRYKRLNMRLLCVVTVLALLTSLVKYAFLPVLVALIIFESVLFYIYLGRAGKFWLSVGFGLSLIGRHLRWLLVVALLLSTVLFVERYGVNLVRYHEAVPDCQQVLNVERCSSYAPWLRDYILSSHKGHNLHGPIGFTNDWLYGMWFRTFFAVDGPGTNFETRGPLTLPGVSAIVLLVGGLIAFIVKYRSIVKRYDKYTVYMFIAVLTGYIGLLWLDEYKSYLHAGMPVAINGRYLLPVLPLLMILLAIGYREILLGYTKIQLALASVGIVCFLAGGGVLTFILRSRDAWYWPNATVVQVNQGVQNSLTNVIPGAHNPVQYLH